MKIINPSFEFVEPINPEQMLDTIEKAYRICYRSESGNNRDDFIRSKIAIGHESPLEHATVSVLITTNRGVTHELVRHRIASYCITGDTVLKAYTGKYRYSPKEWTVKQLFDWQSDVKRKGRIQLINMRSVDEDNVIIPNKIEKIHYMGEKEVYQLTTESGRQIKCTPDHKILTPNGYIELQALSVGNFVMSNGKELLNNEDWIRNYYLTENHTRKETAEKIGCCEATLYKAFKKFNIKKPLSDRPNRHPGHGYKGMFTDEVKRKMSERMLGENNPCYKKDRMQLTIHGGYTDCHRKYDQLKRLCEFCGSVNTIEIHHVDKNPRNNNSDNIKILCAKCHHLWHHWAAIGTFKDKIINIARVGIEPVYDVQMKSPYHNFVANGIVVHNCQESTRYCNYSKDKYDNQLKFIRPTWISEDVIGEWNDRSCVDDLISTVDVPTQIWLESCFQNEGAYLQLLENGWTPQQARDVLNNSLTTNIIVTMNLREWRHFFKLRAVGTTGKPHPEMSQITIPMLKTFKQIIPVVFDDLEAKE